MPYSFHTHSGQFCKHAKGTLEAVVLEAIQQGFKIYGLTEHVPRFRTCDLYPEEEGIALEDLATQFESFLTEAHRLKALYASQILLLVGLETEYITPLDLEELTNLLEKENDRVEYIVGSIHHVNGLPIDFDLETYTLALKASPGENDHAQMETFLCSYFDAQYELLEKFHPEVIGHFDLCRLYQPSLLFSGYSEAWSKAQRNIAFAVEYGALFELNAAALRKGWPTSYPGKDVISEIFRRGGRFTISDDSHGPHAVGLNYPKMGEYMREMKIENIWILEGSDAVNSSGRRVRPKLIEQWSGDSFWSDKLEK